MTNTQTAPLVSVQEEDRETLGFIIDNEQAKNWYKQFVSFSRDILKSGIDFGEIVKGSKPSLLKAGAEKLRFAYGLGVTIEPTTQTIDLKSGLLDFGYVCKVFHGGKQIGACEGSANSYESKYRYIWVGEHELPEGVDKKELKFRQSFVEEFSFAVEKSETGGQYGKPAEYWQKFKDAIASGKAKRTSKTTKSGKSFDAWRIEDRIYQIPHDNPMSFKNTLQKMAQKRAFVGAILIATGASEFFTQDLEDLDFQSAEVVPAESDKVPASAKPAGNTDTDTKLNLPQKRVDEIMSCLDLKELGSKCEQLQHKLGNQYRQSIIGYYRERKEQLMGESFDLNFQESIL
jgi:hypothetical protein